MKETKIKYEDITLDDIDTLSLYHDYICDGDSNKILVKEKEK